MNKWIIGSVIGLSLSGITYFTLKGINAQKDFVSFSINGASAVINQTTGEMDIQLPVGTNLTNLVPTFVSTGSNVTVINRIQYSGISSQNFTSDVPYVVHASDGSTKNYAAHVETTSNVKEAYFNQFYVPLPSGNIAYGQIESGAVNITVPSNTNVTQLTPYFTYVGSLVKVGSNAQISNETQNNFTSPITYSIVNNIGQSNNSTVTVSTAAPTAKDITNFKLITGYGTIPCTINGTNIHCGVPEEVNQSHLIAQWSSTGSVVQAEQDAVFESQVSGLTVNDFSSPVSYKVFSGDGLTNQTYTVTVDNDNLLFEVQNLNSTIFDSTNYGITFKLTNNTASPVTLESATVQVRTPFTWSQTANTCSGSVVAATSSCTVTGTISSSQDEYSTVTATITSNGQTVAHYQKVIKAIPSLSELGLGESYAVYRFTNGGSHRMFATANVNNFSIQFNGSGVGTITANTDKWESYAVEIKPYHDTLYIPAYPGVGGKVLMSVDNKIPNGPTPSVTATNPSDTYYTRWQQVEYGGGLTGESEPALFNLNPTNVDFVSLPVTISTVISGVVGPFNNNDYVEQGILFAPWIKTESTLVAMQTGLTNVENSNESAWEGLVQPDAAGSKILRILSPGSVWPFMSSPTSQFYFDGSIYNDYIDDLWDYYTDTGGGHYLYSNDDPVAELVTPGATCTLRCQVTSSDNLMHCSVFSGTCPTNSSTGTVDGAYDIGGESAVAGFTKFTPGDFVSAAGSNQFTTFGLNGTYRSVTGENIVSAQSVGFLPFCSDVNAVFGEPFFAANSNIYYTPQYTCLTNYANYTVAPIDQYSNQSGQYFFYYNYGYSDTLNQSGAVYSLSNESYPFTVNMNYQ